MELGLLLPILVAGGILLVLMFSGFWMAFALGVTALVAYTFLMGGIQGNFPLMLYNSAFSYGLFAVPLYILMAQILLYGGLIPRLYNALGGIFAPVRGGLLYTNIAFCAIFASICGSSVATTAAVASVAVPELNRRGYDKGISYGSLAAGGPLGTTIPPSTAYVTYGVMAEQSIGRLFMAGIIPGIMEASWLIMVIIVQLLRFPKMAPAREKFVFKAIPYALLQLMPVAVLILMVLVTIYTGIATATEAAALGVAGALVIALAYGGLTWQGLKDSFTEAVKVGGIICLLVATAKTLAFSLAYLGIIDQLTAILMYLPGPPLAKLFQLWLVFGVAGMFIDPTSMIVLSVPIVVPFITALGFDPIWFGVVLVLLCDLGCITPPVGLTLYTVQSITGDDLSVIAKGSIPFWFGLAGAIVTLTLFPQLALWLPGKMFGS